MIFLLVYSVTDRQSFDDIPNIANYIAYTRDTPVSRFGLLCRL